MNNKKRFSNHPYNDERMRRDIEKYMAHGYSITFIISLGSFFIKAVILGMPISSYFVEALIFFIPALYLSIRTMKGGIPVFLEPKNNWEKKYLIFSDVIGGIVFGLLTGFFDKDNKIIVNGHINPRGVMISIISGVAFGTFMYLFMRKSNKVAEANGDKIISKEMDDN